jgi:hypothetical protein
MKEALNDLKVRQKSEKAQIEISEPMSPSVDAAVVKQRMEERERLRQQQRQETEGAAEQAKKAQEDLRKQRFTKLKGELAKRKVERPQKIEEAPVEHVEVRRSQFSTQDWAKMRRRDDALIERKNAIAQAQEEQRIKREEIQRKLADQVGRKFRHAKRDPERLMQPTAAVRARMEAKDDEPKGPVNSVFEIPHRAMPAWMQ